MIDDAKWDEWEIAGNHQVSMPENRRPRNPQYYESHHSYLDQYLSVFG